MKNLRKFTQEAKPSIRQRSEVKCSCWKLCSFKHFREYNWHGNNSDPLETKYKACVCTSCLYYILSDKTHQEYCHWSYWSAQWLFSLDYHQTAGLCKLRVGSCLCFRFLFVSAHQVAALLARNMSQQFKGWKDCRLTEQV